MESAEFRLVDDYGNSVGDNERGLLLYNGGTVCDDHFDQTAANAICIEMGFSGAVTWASGSYFESQYEFTIGLDEVHCESNLWESCTWRTDHDCSHNEDVFLTCSSPVTTQSEYLLECLIYCNLF